MPGEISLRSSVWKERIVIFRSGEGANFKLTRRLRADTTMLSNNEFSERRARISSALRELSSLRYLRYARPAIGASAMAFLILRLVLPIVLLPVIFLPSPSPRTPGIAPKNRAKAPAASETGHSNPTTLHTSSLSSVSGVVVDPSGAVVSGATVTLHRKGHDSEQSIKTDTAGAFRFDGLSVGEYEIHVDQDEFKPSKVSVKVDGHTPTQLRIALSIADHHEEVQVEGGDGQVNTDLAENLDTVSLDRQALDDLPMLGGDIVGTISRVLDGSGGSGAVTLVVDGMEASDVPVPTSSIQQVKINNNPYSAEFSQPGKGRVEIVTKEGSSKYHGSFTFGLRDYRLDARNAFAVERPEEQRRHYEGYLSGPVGTSKKTTFVISANRDESDLQSVIYALTPSGAIRQNFLNPQHSTFLTTRVSQQIGKNNSISLRYSFFDWSDKGAGVGGFNLPEVGMDLATRKHYVYYSHKAVVTPKLVNELSFQATRGETSTRSLSPGSQKIVVQDAFTGGGAQAEARQTGNSFQLSDVLSWSRGRHFVKGGINIPNLSRHESDDRSNFDGTFYFSSLEDYNLGRPFSFFQRQGNPYLAFWQKEVGFFAQDDIRIRSNLSMGFGVRYEWQNFLSDHNNVAPRWSFAFAPGNSRKTVFRGGAGLFYDRTGERPIADMLRFDGYRMQQFAITNPGYPVPLSLGGTFSAQPSSIVRFASDLRSPYTLQYSFGVERQLKKKTSLTATYIGVPGISLFRSRDVNAPLPPLYGERPDPSVAILRQVESSAHMSRHALNLAVRGEITRFFSGAVQYTLARSYDDTGGIDSFPANNHDLSKEWSRANSDARHGLYLYGTLNPGRFFKLGVVLSARSGRPYSLTTGLDENRDSFATDRPFGVPRNSLEGPGSVTLDLRWSKEFYFWREKKNKGPSAGISLDAFNVLNQVNLGKPVGNLSSPFFGLPVSSGPARQMQLSFGFKF
jgi:carboxypeptidase family protein